MPISSTKIVNHQQHTIYKQNVRVESSRHAQRQEITAYLCLNYKSRTKTLFIGISIVLMNFFLINILQIETEMQNFSVFTLITSKKINK